MGDYHGESLLELPKEGIWGARKGWRRSGGSPWGPPRERAIISDSGVLAPQGRQPRPRPDAGRPAHWASSMQPRAGSSCRAERKGSGPRTNYPHLFFSLPPPPMAGIARGIQGTKMSSGLKNVR